MIKKIILLVGSYFTSRDYERFGIETLQSNKLEVCIWDLSNFLYPNSTNSIKKGLGVFNKKNVYRPDNINQVIYQIEKENCETFFMSLIYYTHKTILVFKAISRAGCKYGCTGPYTYNFYPKPQTSTLNNITKKRIPFNRFTARIKHEFEKFYFNISPYIFGINKANYYAIAGGSKAYAKGPLINNRTYIQSIHARDFDIFLKKSSYLESLDNGGFIVFIDQYLPFHPDNYNTKNPLQINAELYYRELTLFFDKIESITRKKVIIAAHPKASYTGKENLFGKRTIIHNHDSLDLIKRSDLVLLHFSAAINLAVILKKPIVFITSDELNNSNVGAYINAFASKFNTLALNISNNYSFHIPKIDKEFYDSYFIAYIKKSDTKEELFWQQVANYIKRIN
jgi:hypothetical protein